MSGHSKAQPQPLAGARVLLFLNLPLQEVEGEYSARYPHLFDFFLALGSVTAETALMVPLKRGGPRNPDYGTVTVPAGVRIVGLPHWSSARMMVRRFPWVVAGSVRIAVENLRRVDVVGAVAPSVVGTVLITLARLWRHPTFLLVRGEKQRTLRFIMGQRRARPYVLALRAMEVPVRHWISAGVPTFVAGHELIERYAAPDARLYDLYPALSRDFPIAAAPRDGRGAREDGIRLVTVARLSPEKGFDDLLRSIALLRDRGAAAAIEIVGDGPQRAELEELVDQLDLGRRVRFAGFVPHGPELVSILDRNDVFVLASRSEGLPHSLVEAMARGLPVVATAVGGIPAFLEDGSGVVVPIGDPVALAGALEDLARDSGRRTALSALALQKARRLEPEAQLAELTAHLADAYPAVAEPPGRSRAPIPRHRKREQRDVLVLSYHGVSRDWPAALGVMPDRLAEQLEWLVGRGYEGATLQEAVNAPPAPRTLAVTFDDGYRSVLERALPILERLGLPGTVFVPTDFPDRDQPMSWPGIDNWLGGPHEDELRCLSWPELHSLADRGWEIGAHSCSHPYLTRLDNAALERELRHSRQRCEQELGRECRSLAYPYGDHDTRVEQAARTAGFTVACTVPDKLATGDPLRYPRIGIYRSDGMLSFRAKVSIQARRVRRTPAARAVLPLVRSVR